MNLYQPTITGSLSVSGSINISGSINVVGGGGTITGTASYATNADLLDGLDSTVFTLTSSFAAQTASFTAFTSSVNTFTASQNILNGTYTLTSSFAAQTASFTAFTSSVNTFTASINSFSASVLSYTSSLNAKTSSFATTGSNTFEGIQTINSNLIVTGSITAQTLVVQTITSSVSFITGSTRFGSLSSNTHVFTGSMAVTGGLVDINKDGQSLKIFPQSSSGSARIQLQNSGSGGLAGANAIIAVESSTGADQFSGTSPFSLVIGTATQKAFHLGANSAVVMTITGSSVGIGTTNPTEILEVSGSIRALQATNDGICQLITDSSNSTTYRAALATFGNTAVGTLLGITRASNSFLYKNGAALIIGTGASDPLIFSTNSTERMRITSAGVVELPYGQIKFPATQNASADANTLDDYEEGTFTPNVGENATYSTQLGEYTKIGNMVYVRGQLVINIIGNGSTTNFGGLPFNSSLENGFCINKLTHSSLNFYSIYLRTSGTLVYASYQSALDGTLVVNPAYLTDSTEIQFSGCYRTS